MEGLLLEGEGAWDGGCSYSERTLATLKGCSYSRTFSFRERELGMQGPLSASRDRDPRGLLAGDGGGLSQAA
jgi:hypothetical protein